MKTSLLILLATASMFAADNGNRNFPVRLTGCREYVAFGPISYAAAQASLPPGFTAVNIGGAGGLVIRASYCQGAEVDGGPAKPAIVAHYGIQIVPPDGTGDINNYTLSFATTSEALADRLRKSGMPTVLNPALSVEDPAVRPGNVYIGAFGDGLIPWFVTGTVSDPAGPPFPFVANWWYSGKFGSLKISTDITAIAFGAAGLVLNTASSSQLGALIGGNTDSNFPFYNVRGVFNTATLSVTVR